MKTFRLTGYEFIKVYKHRWFIVLILAAVAANLILLNMEIHREDGLLLEHIDLYSSITEEYAEMPIDQAHVIIQGKMETLDFYIELIGLSMQMDHYVDPNTGDLYDEENRRSIDHLEEILEEMRERNPDAFDTFFDDQVETISGNINIDHYLFSRVHAVIAHITSYDEYLQGIDEQAAIITSVSIFSDENSFSHRNILKTARDFDGNKGAHLSYDIPEGINSVMDYKMTDILVLGIILMTCILLISHEKDRDILRFIRTMRYGRINLVFSKLNFLIINSTLLTLLFYGSNIMMAHRVFGIGDTQRTVQSIPSFMLFNWVMSVREFLSLYLLFKVGVVILCGLIMMCFFIMIKQTSIAYMAITALFGFSYATYQLLPVNSYINHVKFINIFNFLETETLFTSYINLNFFGYPVGLKLIFTVLVPVSCMLFIFLNIIGYLGIKQGSFEFAAKVMDGITRLIDGIFHHSNTFLHEVQRTLLTHKGTIVLAMLSLFLYQGIKDNVIIDYSEDVIYRDYMSIWGGEVTDDTLRLIRDERDYLDRIPEKIDEATQDHEEGLITQQELSSRINRLRAYSERSEGFYRLEQQAERLAAVAETSGHNVWLLDTTGYKNLFGLSRSGDGSGDFTDDLRNMLLASLTIIIILSPIYSNENKKNLRHIVKVCKKGRTRLVFIRLIVGILISVATMTVVYGMQLYDVYRLYDISAMRAPVQSLEGLHEFPVGLSIGNYSVVVLAIRFIGYSMITALILLISSLAKNAATSVILSILIVCAPIIAYLLEMDFILNLSLIPILSANMLFVSRGSAVVLTASLWMIFTFALGVIFYCLKSRFYVGSTTKPEKH